jgi:uncharacterized protein with von Willebrand factor type A (vWA) domain
MELADIRKALLIYVFVQLQRRGVALGIDNLLAALRAVDHDWDATPAALKDLMILLWCQREQDEQALEAILAAVTAPLVEDLRDEGSDLAPVPDDRPPPPHESLRLPEAQPAAAQSENARDDWALILVQAPPHERNELLSQADWPAPQRFMAYAWRRLRLSLPGVGEEEVDIRATVERVARWGFFLEPVYRQRPGYRAHLSLFIDQDGSMMPFHRFARDLLATARQELGADYVEVSYFHNAPTDQIYTDPYLTKRKLLDAALDTCSHKTAVLIVSDAGAARGSYHPARIRTTDQFLARVRRHTNLVSWLNPLPEERWPATSAGVIARFVPMFTLSPRGLSQAIDVAREQLPAVSW